MKKILMVSHVIPCPPSAGNEVRIYNLLKWLKLNGYTTCFILRPLERVEFNTKALSELKKLVDVLYVFDDRASYKKEEARLSRLDGFIDSDIGDKHITDIQEGFCPLFFLAEVEEIIKDFRPNVVISQYIFMSRILRILPENVLKIIDTHDIFHSKHETVRQYNIENYSLNLTSEQEKRLLNRADIVLAIQQSELEQLKVLANKADVILTSVDFDVPEKLQNLQVPGRVIIIASNNEFNVKGVKDFIKYTWPLVREHNPHAHLRVIGRVCEHIRTYDPSINLVGFVKVLNEEYAQAEVVVNPTRVGTGLKIKTIEALSMGRSHIAWPAAADGLRELEQGYLPIVIAHNIVEFAQGIVELLENKMKRHHLESYSRDFVCKHFGQQVYASFAKALESHFLSSNRTFSGMQA